MTTATHHRHHHYHHRHHRIFPSCGVGYGVGLQKDLTKFYDWSLTWR